MLDTVEHARLIADLPHVCSIAGVQPKFLHESMTHHCGTNEVDWVKNFWKYTEEGCPGLVLSGTRPDTRCQAIGAALVRNFIDARVVPLNSLLDHLQAGDVPSPTVLLIPNLFTVALHKAVPAWRVQMVYDLLLERSTHGKPTVVYIENMKQMTLVYGAVFADFLSNFKQVG